MNRSWMMQVLCPHRSPIIGLNRSSCLHQRRSGGKHHQHQRPLRIDRWPSTASWTRWSLAEATVCAGRPHQAEPRFNLGLRSRWRLVGSKLTDLAYCWRVLLTDSPLGALLAHSFADEEPEDTRLEQALIGGTCDSNGLGGCNS
jgi:hypothetical protein